MTSFIAFTIIVAIGLYFADKHDRQKFQAKVREIDLDDYEEKISK